MEALTATMTGWQRVMVALLAALVVVAWGAALQAMYFVAIPLVYAFVLASLVRPLQRGISGALPEKLKWLGVLVAVLALFLMIAAVAGVVALLLHVVRTDWEGWRALFAFRLEQVSAWAEARGLLLPREAIDIEGLQAALMSAATTLFVGFWTLAAMVALVLIFVTYMLTEADAWATSASGAGQSRLSGGIQLASANVRHFLMVKTLANSFSGVSETLVFWALGAPMPYVWGLLFFIMNYVVNIGPAIAAVPPLLFVAMLYGWERTLIGIAFVTVIEGTIGNFIDPRLQGRILRVSPITIMVSILFWGWVWGFAGAFIAVPLTVTFVTIFTQFESTVPLAMLLSRSSTEEDLGALSGES